MENAEIKRTFIEVPLFSKRWKEIGLDDEKKVLKKLVKALKEEAAKNRR